MDRFAQSLKDDSNKALLEDVCPISSPPDLFPSPTGLLGAFSETGGWPRSTWLDMSWEIVL